jgi:TonB family protein
MKRVSLLLAGVIGVSSAASFVAQAAAADVSAGCAVYVAHAERLDDAGSRYAFALQTFADGRTVTGTLALFTQGARYDVPFASALAPGISAGGTPSPVVVQFPGPVRLDGAYVAVAGGERCSAPYQPWVGSDNDAVRIGSVMTGRPRPPRLPDDVSPNRARWDAFRTLAAAAAAPLSAGAPVTLAPLACKQPARAATTVHAAEPDVPTQAINRGASGVARVLVLLDARGALTGAQVVSSSLDRALDASALDAAKRAEFRPAIFRCEAVAGAYIFTVGFGF